MTVREAITEAMYEINRIGQLLSEKQYLDFLDELAEEVATTAQIAREV